jgi:hypothetical protein
MREWRKRGRNKWQDGGRKNTKAFFAKNGGLSTFVSNCMVSCGNDKEKRLLIFSKKEERDIDKTARNYLPKEDRPRSFLKSVLSHLTRDCPSTRMYVVWVANDPNIPIIKASKKQRRLAIRIG